MVRQLNPMDITAYVRMEPGVARILLLKIKVQEY